MDTNNPYDFDTSDDEDNELQKLMQSNEVPEPDEQDGANTEDDGEEPRPSPDEGDESEPAAKDPPADDDADDGGDDSGDELQAFLDKHKGKSPEELARLAFQQSKRANRASYDQRQAQERLGSVLERIEAARKARLDDIAARRDQFAKKVSDDPDGALLDAHQAQLDREAREAEEAAEREQFEARAQEAIQLASAAIPDFQNRAPVIRDFATEMGFTQEEVAGIVDGRQIVTLHLAQIAGNMLKAGLIDASGNFLQLPKPVEERGGGQQQQQTQRRTQFTQQPARGAGRQPTLEQRLADIANMSDEDLAKIPDAELEALLAQADGQG